MAIFRREASLAKPVLFLYFLINVLLAVTALNSLVHHWNDPSQIADVETGSLSFTNIPSSVSLRTSAKNIKLQDIPQVIPLALGFSSLQNVDWDGLLAGNIFNRPKANVLFIINGVSKGNTVSLSGKSPTYTIIKNKAESNLDIFLISPIHNFVSHISHVLKDKPLVISFSAQKQFASAASTSGRNAHTVSWDAETEEFKDEAGSNTMELFKDKLLKMFETADFGKGVKYLKKEHRFVVSGMEDVSFDMNEMNDFLFFAEIQTLFYLYEKVKNLDSLVHDDYTDFFTFAISSVKGLSERYGNGSQQVAAAIRILNNVIPEVTKLFSELYGGQALVEVVNLEQKEGDEQKVMPTEQHYMYEEDERSLRVRRDTSIRKNTKCENSQNFAIVDDYYDNEFPPIFNICLWLMVILVLTVYAVSVVMWNMDPGRDSIIYRVTSQRMKSE